MHTESNFSEKWKLSMRLTFRGFLVALAGFLIAVAGTLPWLMILGVVGYFITVFGIAVGFVGMFAPPTSPIFRLAWRTTFRRELAAEK